MSGAHYAVMVKTCDHITISGEQTWLKPGRCYERYIFTIKKVLMEIGINLILGSATILYGLYTLIARQIAPEKFAKLQTMEEKYGIKMARSIHIIGYTVIPIVAGAPILVAHFRG